MWFLLLFAQLDEPSPSTAPPLVGRPPHFYGAIGAPVSVPNGDVRVELTAEPTTVKVGDDIALTITVRRVHNPADVQQIDLNELKIFTHDFQIDAGPTSVDAANQSVTFHYTLRPRRANVTEIPAPPFKYFRPGHLIPHKGYMGARVNSVPLVVQSRTPPPVAVVPLEVPDFALDLAPRADPVPEPEPIPAWLAFLALIAPSVVALGWYGAWSRRNPHRARGSSRAGRRALAALRTQEPTEVVRTYLAERFAVPATARTPSEVAGLVPADRQAPTLAFWQTVDAARFGPGSTASLRSAAEQLIHTLETSGP